MAKHNKKNKLNNYNAGTIVIDIIMLLLGLVFFIGTLAGKGDDIAAGFVRIVGVVLILIGIFELINFLRIKDKSVFDWTVLIIGCAIAVVGIVFIINPMPVVTVFNFIFGIIISIYAIVIIVSSVGTLRPAGAKYWWFSLLFGIIALGLGIFIVFFNLATKTLSIIIGITLVLGSIGGIANALLASQAKKAFKADSRILDDADFTATAASQADNTGSDAKKSGDDAIKY